MPFQIHPSIEMISPSDVAILIPIYKPTLNELERISLIQAVNTLHEFPFHFVTHRKIDVKKPLDILFSHNKKVQPTFFPSKYFSSVEGYSQLLTSYSFYWAFRKYKYILIFQLDAFVFKNELLYWCAKDYDYIGAPWLNGWEEARENDSFMGVGNGGFSLRKVSSALRVLRQFSYLRKPEEMIDNVKDNKSIRAYLSFIKNLTISNNTFTLMHNFRGNEDGFWGIYANRNFSWFKVPEPEEALKFSMEVHPKRMYEFNKKKLPFGCHAWWKYDLEFWRPFIEIEGHVLPALKTATGL